MHTYLYYFRSSLSHCHLHMTYKPPGSFVFRRPKLATSVASRCFSTSTQFDHQQITLLSRQRPTGLCYRDCAGRNVCVSHIFEPSGTEVSAGALEHLKKWYTAQGRQAKGAIPLTQPTWTSVWPLGGRCQLPKWGLD